ncbi:M15 family metallopeptidase [Clostridium oryzae]|uniref:Peptidase M15C domain-containing protein n=1 Tax=Clostridium oryzae TaxID=1450648 RepID=A0A1V4IQV0_9CLOT|nr:M15 family metallopeptidase [Clostridium oryzae]OPJ62401.1 hypothetical protein CLORY_17700 [Clostridium oryzae]
MKRRILLFFLFFVVLVSVEQNTVFALVNEDDDSGYKRIKQDLLCMYMGYHDYIEGFEKSGDKIFIKFRSGNKVIYDDKIEKGFQQMLVNADVEDSLKQLYPLQPVTKLSEQDFDPGRMRPYAFLSEIYGRNRSELSKNIVNVATRYKNYSFNRNNGAADALKNTMNELTSFSNGSFNRFLFPGCGTYNYRVISGTGRLSPHAFGIAIDINSDRRDYWKWCTREQGEKRILEYPKDMVNIFEKNYFIWGGKWGHFDTLHFEYRPEIIIKARYFTNTHNSEKWYGKLDVKNPVVEKGISLINAAFE